MKKRPFDKQINQLENKPLGRSEPFCEYDAKTERFNYGIRRGDAKTKPPLETTYEFPVGRRRGVVKPGS